MKTRHRTPTIFSIYMVDVLCCALGCVILLWLVNFREAKHRAAAASESNQRLTKTQSALDTSASDLARTRSALADSQDREKTLTTSLARLQAQHDDREKTLTASLARLQARHDESVNSLAFLKKEQEESRLALALSDKQLSA